MIIVDSGAFSVWQSGGVVDLDKYIEWCRDHVDGVDRFVNLDVIPDQKKERTSKNLNQAAEEGWNNWKRMTKKLPKDKLIPVVHRGENLKWIEKYIDDGSDFVGLNYTGGEGYSPTFEKIDWLNDVSRILIGSDRRPIVKVHGFGTTHPRMMIAFPYYSVDSIAWILNSAYGFIYMPGGGNRFDVQLNVAVSALMKPENAGSGQVSGETSWKEVRAWLKSIGLRMGVHQEMDVPEGHEKEDDEVWCPNTDKRKVLKISKRGVSNCQLRRLWANAVYFMRLEDVLPVKKICLAGSVSCPDAMEEQIPNRLLSYFGMENRKGKGYQILMGHIERAKTKNHY